MRELARRLQLRNAIPVNPRRLPQTYRIGQAASWAGVGLLGALWMIQVCHCDAVSCSKHTVTSKPCGYVSSTLTTSTYLWSFVLLLALQPWSWLKEQIVGSPEEEEKEGDEDESAGSAAADAAAGGGDDAAEAADEVGEHEDAEQNGGSSATAADASAQSEPEESDAATAHATRAPDGGDGEEEEVEAAEA